MKFLENVALSRFSHYKIGGSARYFFAPKSEKDLEWAAHEAKALGLPVFILGGGTNLLIGDEGFEGLVLKAEFDELSVAKDVLTVGAGVSVSDLLDFTVAKSLAGMEWAGGLPGTLGGAVRGNAGCFGGEMKDVVASVRSFNMKTMKFKERSAKACAFDYRHSIFKEDPDEVIVSANLKMEPGDKKKIAEAIHEKIEYRRKNHPLEYPNIGSTFKNVPLLKIYKKGSREYEEAGRALTVMFQGSQFSVKTDPFLVISAAKMIGESGLRGVSFGGAMISPKHPNFIVNILNARADDVKGLIELTKQEVHKKFGVELEEEVQIL